MSAHIDPKPKTFWVASWIREGPAQDVDKLYDPEDRNETEEFHVAANEYKVTDLEEYDKACKAATEAQPWESHSKAKEKIKVYPFRLMFEHQDIALESVSNRSTYFCRRRMMERIFALGPTKEAALNALGKGVATYGGAALKHLESKPQDFIEGLSADIKARLAEKIATDKAQEASRRSLEQHEVSPDIDMY